MRNSLVEQARQCRNQALDYAGRPEREFLLKVAQAFDELAVAPAQPIAPRKSAVPHLRSEKTERC